MSDTLTGSVERITYYNDETNYCVLRLRPDQLLLGRDDLVTVVGAMPELQPGENVRLQGEWTNHPRHGRQFRAEVVTQVRPASVEAIKRYLGSGLIKGVGPVTAKRIVEFFGAETLDVLDRTPGRVLEVPGVGNHRARLIGEAWQAQQHIKEVMLFLQGHGITTGLAVKIYKQYGDQAIPIVSRDPYRLATDIFGIGFRTADKIARDLGLPPDAPSRIAAGIIFALNDATDNGHVFLPRDELVEAAAAMLEVDPPIVEETVKRLAARADVLIEAVPIPDGLQQVEGVYLPPMYYSEKGAATRLKLMAEAFDSRLADLRHTNWDKLLGDLAAHSPVVLSRQQQDAVRSALTHKVSILTGPFPACWVPARRSTASTSTTKTRWMPT
jgi:exodeoxyribonuclease V alpha subunit